MSPTEDELLIFCDCSCIASVPIWQDDDYEDGLWDESYANAEFIVRACKAHGDLVDTLKLALYSVRRFRVADTDSSRIASRIDDVLIQAEVQP